MKNITKSTAVLMLFLVVAGFYSCNKQQNLQPEEKSAAPRKVSSLTTQEQAYLNLLNSDPDIVYQWEPKKFTADLSVMTFPMDAYSNEYMYYNNQVVRIGKGTVDFIVKDWDTWKRLKQNSAAYAAAADYFRGKREPAIKLMEVEVAGINITSYRNSLSQELQMLRACPDAVTEANTQLESLYTDYQTRYASNPEVAISWFQMKYDFLEIGLSRIASEKCPVTLPAPTGSGTAENMTEMAYTAEWFEIEDSFAVLAAELASQGIADSDPIPEMYYKKDGIPVDMINASPRQGRTVFGIPRNFLYFWEELYKKKPEMFSEDNIRAIFTERKSPIVNEQWVRYNPSHAQYIDDKLIHHHDRQGRYAYALPQKIHQKYNAVFHKFRSKGGVSGISGKLNVLAGALQIFSIVTDLSTGNPDGWVNWFGPQNVVGKIYKDNEKGVYFQIVSKRETKDRNGIVISAVVTYYVFADYFWDEDENRYVGLQRLGVYTEHIDVKNVRTLSKSFEII